MHIEHSFKAKNLKLADKERVITNDVVYKGN